MEATRAGPVFLTGAHKTLTDSIIKNNHSGSAAGGGIFNNGGIVNLINSTVSNNSA